MIDDFSPPWSWLTFLWVLSLIIITFFSHCEWRINFKRFSDRRSKLILEEPLFKNKNKRKEREKNSFLTSFSIAEKGTQWECVWKIQCCRERLTKIFFMTSWINFCWMSKKSNYYWEIQIYKIRYNKNFFKLNNWSYCVYLHARNHTQTPINFSLRLSSSKK